MSFQGRAFRWGLFTFGSQRSRNLKLVAYRMLEEANELAQACGITEADAGRLVGYTWNRARGSIADEIGGVMITTARLAALGGYDMQQCGEDTLQGAWERGDLVRKKDLTKPLPDALVGEFL